MDKHFDKLILQLKNNLKLSLSISFGVFLFLLFFQPFSVERFDFNNWIVFKVGFGIIIFIFTIFVEVIFPWLIKEEDVKKNETPSITLISGFSLFILNSLGFAFYLYYIGKINITFDLMLKIILISIAPPILLKLHDYYINLSEKNKLLSRENQTLKKQIKKYDLDYRNKSIELYSESGKEAIKIYASQIAYLKSADNYVEIVYNEYNIFKKKLLRNTLRNMEQQIMQYSNFIRCHRTCIVNINYVENLHSDYNKHWLSIKGYDETVPVSRQYLYKLKEVI